MSHVTLGGNVPHSPYTITLLVLYFTPNAILAHLRNILSALWPWNARQIMRPGHPQAQWRSNSYACNKIIVFISTCAYRNLDRTMGGTKKNKFWSLYIWTSTLKLFRVNTYIENISYLQYVCPCPDSPRGKGISRHNEDQVWTCKYMKLTHQGSINHTLLVGEMDYSVHRKQYQNSRLTPL